MCVVVIDSPVWIKLYCGGLHIKVLALGDRICSVDHIVEEELLAQPRGVLLREHGLRVESVSGDGVARALGWRAEHPELSVGDSLSLALALEQGWQLATHDALLEGLAERVSVPILCVVDVLMIMAEAGILTEYDIRRFRRRMYEADEPYDTAKLKPVLRIAKVQETSRQNTGGGL